MKQQLAASRTYRRQRPLAARRCSSYGKCPRRGAQCSLDYSRRHMANVGGLPLPAEKQDSRAQLLMWQTRWARGARSELAASASKLRTLAERASARAERSYREDTTLPALLRYTGVASSGFRVPSGKWRQWTVPTLWRWLVRRHSSHSSCHQIGDFGPSLDPG